MDNMMKYMGNLAIAEKNRLVALTLMFYKSIENNLPYEEKLDRFIKFSGMLHGYLKIFNELNMELVIENLKSFLNPNPKDITQEFIDSLTQMQVLTLFYLNEPKTKNEILDFLRSYKFPITIYSIPKILGSITKSIERKKLEYPIVCQESDKYYMAEEAKQLLSELINKRVAIIKSMSELGDILSPLE